MNDQSDNPSAAGAGGASGAPVPHVSASAPTILGDFELRREIGRGGMGTVYEAWQRSLKRIVAVKVLSRQVSASPTAVVRFQREAQAAAKLHHPHIVPIFALGQDEETYYYAMEFVDGPGLNAIIAGARKLEAADTASADLAETVALSRAAERDADPRTAKTQASPAYPDADDTAVTLSSVTGIHSSEDRFAAIARHIACIADALDYAHQHGVIHRDVKPHNLLLGKDGKMRISDFGLARLSEQPGVTITGEMIGSPLYMSPEQISGEASKVDHRTDIYSLGATMYEWLALTPPYPGETRERVISRVLTSEALPLRHHNAQIPVDLETVCLRAIERDRRRRYRTAGELRDDLRRFLAKRPIRARRTGAATKLKRFIRRHQLASLGAAAAAAALGLSFALVNKQREVRTQAAVAEQFRKESERVLDLVRLLPLEIGGPLRVAEAAVPMLGDVVQGGRSTRIENGDPQSAGADPGAAREPAKIARRAAHDFLNAVAPAGWLASGPDATEGFSSLLTRAADRWDEEPRLAYELVTAYLQDYPDDFNARQLQAALCARLGYYDRMLESANVLVRLRPGDPNAYTWRALGYLVSDRPEDGLGDLDRAMQRTAPSAWILALRGLALVQKRSPAEAVRAFDGALEDEPDFPVALLGRAAGRAALGNLRDAVADLTHLLKLEPDNANVLALRGDHYFARRDFAAAEHDFERAMRVGGRTPSMVLRYLSALSQRRNVTKRNAVKPGLPDDPKTETGSGKPTKSSSTDSVRTWFSRLLFP